MLYLDYSRPQGQWVPNQYGGRENLAAVSFLHQMNTATHSRAPGSITVAEESTSWPAVSRPTYVGGLGFTYKWNMGRSEEHTSELQSPYVISYAVFCLKKKT